jgi:hypothetical protein
MKSPAFPKMQSFTNVGIAAGLDTSDKLYRMLFNMSIYQIGASIYNIYEFKISCYLYMEDKGFDIGI